ncbi:MAG: deoxyribodipyrimidine photo-lyase [Deltaproteobacteria bacterium]|nr:MAG: deoxyribodipyrimidine photo-lyase [Deltaproteobacteria bacterium]
MAELSIVWFRGDLRLDDHPALCAGVKRGAVLPLYVLEPCDAAGGWPPGGASRWWLHHSLASLSSDLERLGSPLVLRRGRALEVLEDVVGSSGATAVFWNRRYDPAGVAVDRGVKAALKARGLEVRSFRGGVLWEPWEVETKGGDPYRVFTPFHRRIIEQEREDEPLEAPAAAVAPELAVRGDALEELGLLPRLDWADGFGARWVPGEGGAREKLERFLDDSVNGYGERRDRPDVRGTSRLSPHLRHGEISPRRVRRAVRDALGGGGSAKDHRHFLREIAWREFAWHLLYHFPKTPDEPLRPEYASFPWTRDEALLEAWKRGRTGYPLVDAGMRELWATGWMHNRVRMLVASFLVKHLLQPWQEGARWFWDTLVDADLANNTLGWQWAAGCGADAAPYFRVFNPTLQARKFDPEGAYIARWVPELAGLAPGHRHAPFEAPEACLREAGVVLGETYPAPLIAHQEGRARALDAWERFRERGQG